MLTDEPTPRGSGYGTRTRLDDRESGASREAGHAGQLAGSALEPLVVPARRRGHPERPDRARRRAGHCAAGRAAGRGGRGFRDCRSGARLTVRELLQRTFTDGFLVLKGSRVACERYYNGMTPATPHLLQSVSKSLTGALAGVLAGRRPSGAGADGRGLRAGTRGHFVRRRHGPASPRYVDRYDVLRGIRRPRVRRAPLRRSRGWRPTSHEDDLDLFGYMLTLRNHRAHGGVFEYRSILTDLLGCLIERAGGARFADLMSEHIWSRLGAEQDARITVDRHGNPIQTAA